MLLRSVFLFLTAIAALTVTTEAADEHDVWIARRADGKAGSGTAVDPFDGSTSQQLDAVLRRVFDIEGVRIHFGPGTFLTKSVLAGDPVFIRKPHTTILGAGMYRTTLALDPAIGPNLPPWAFSVLQTDQQIAPDSHLTVQDMTIDTNWPKLVKPRRDISIGNVSLTGSYCSIIRVRGINAHGDHASGKECFGIAIGCGGPYNIHDGLIANCVAESPRGDYGNAVTMAGWTFDVYPATTSTGIIRGCKVYDMRADHKHMAAYATAGGVLTDCYAENSTIGVYMECARDLTISNCEFRNNIWRGVWVCPANNYGGVQKFKILNSTIEASDFETGAACIEVGSGDGKNLTEDALISGNRLMRRNAKPRQKAHSIITAVGISGLSVVGNRIDRKLDHSLVRNATMQENRALDGATITMLPDVVADDHRARFLQPPPTRQR